MWCISRFVLVLSLLVLPTTVFIASNGGSSLLVRADDVLEDEIIDEESEGVVESDEEDTVVSESERESVPIATGEADEEEEDKPLKPSSDVSTRVLFTKPSSAHDLPAGQLVKLLVGFHNKGDKEFVISSLDASFRYPQDFSYYIQNFTSAQFDKTVSPNQEVTLFYTFTPNEAFSGRPLGLSILLHYKDNDNNLYMDALFNDTVTIADPDEGLDGETFFLYIFLAALVVLVVVVVHQVLMHKKVRSKLPMKTKRPIQIETGTQNTDVDVDWLPMEHIRNSAGNSSPGRSPSGRDRRTPESRKRRNRGAED